MKMNLLHAPFWWVMQNLDENGKKPNIWKGNFVASNNRAENSYTQALLPIAYNNQGTICDLNKHVTIIGWQRPFSWCCYQDIPTLVLSWQA